MQDEAKNRGEMWDMRNFKGGYGMKTERWDWDMHRFIGRMRDRPRKCEIISYRPS